MSKHMIMLSHAASIKATGGAYTFVNSCIAVVAKLNADGYYVVKSSNIISAYALIAEPLTTALLDNVNQFPHWEFKKGEVIVI